MKPSANGLLVTFVLFGLLLALNLLPLLSSCRRDPGTYAPTERDCTEFDWTSPRGPDLKMKCRILWCVQDPGTQSAIGGPTTLWCEPYYKDVRGSWYYGENVEPEEVRAVLDDAGPRMIGDRQ